MISLTTCVKGQKLRLRNGEIGEYRGRNHCPDSMYNHMVYWNAKRFTYTDSGNYFLTGQDMRDVIEILPLETTKPAPHPSIAWWESCPWITDRKPTKEDADKFGRVLVIAEPDKILTASFQDVRIAEAWIHHGGWQPPAPTDREQALQLLDDHQAGWMPTPGQWHIIRKGLEAS